MFLNMETARSLFASILLRQIWPIVDHNNHYQTPNLHFNVTLKLIAFTLTCDHKEIQSFLCIALESELPKVIITGANLSDIPEKFHIFRNVRTYENSSAISPPSGALRFSPHAENSFIDLHHPSIPNAVMTSEFFQLNSDYKSTQYRGRIQFPYNMNPQRVHHIFVGTQPQLRACFKRDSVNVLKYKTGIVVDYLNAKSFGKIMVERYLENSRESAFILAGTSSFGAPYGNRFGLLKNRRLTVQSYATPYHVLYDEQKRPHAGLNYEVIKCQADYYNFTFDYRTDGWRNIGQSPNGSWNGFIGKLIEDETDIAMWLSLHAKRNPFVEIPAQYFYETFGPIVPLPRETIKWYAMIYQFELAVWIGIGISSLAISSLFCVYYSKEVKVTKCGTSRTEIAYLSFAAPVRMFLREPADLPIGAKLSSMIFLFGAFIVGIFFDSNLMSFLTLPEYEHVPSTVEELARAADYKLAYVDFQGSAGEEYLRETNRPAVKEIVPRLNVTPPKVGIEALVRTAMEPKTVTLNYQKISIINVAANLTLYPGIYPVTPGEILLGFHVGPALRKYSKLSEPMGANMRAFSQAGLIAKWSDDGSEFVRRRGRAWLKKDRKELYEQLKALAWDTLYPSVRPFTLQHFTFSFLCLLIGSALSVVAFVSEVFPKKLTHFVVKHM